MEMANLIGSTADETRDNVLRYAHENGMRVIEDRKYDGLLEEAIGATADLVYLLTISKGTQEVRINIVRDGRMSRQIINR